MFYAFSCTPTEDELEETPRVLDMHLTAGVIHQVDILFQDGCNHVEYVQIFDGNYQVWPSNRGGAFRGNATVVSFREFYELVPGNTNLKAHVWTAQLTDNVEVIIQIGVLPKAILQPVSFQELLKAATGV